MVKQSSALSEIRHDFEADAGSNPENFQHGTLENVVPENVSGLKRGDFTVGRF